MRCGLYAFRYLTGDLRLSLHASSKRLVAFASAEHCGMDYGLPGNNRSGMDLQLEGKRALVTGSTAGIGFATAKGLAKEGAAVIVNGRSTKRVDEAVAALNKAGISELEGLAADLNRRGNSQGRLSASRKAPFWSTTWASSRSSPSKTYPTPTGCGSSK
jgi:hypothetical protein